MISEFSKINKAIHLLLGLTAFSQLNFPIGRKLLHYESEFTIGQSKPRSDSFHRQSLNSEQQCYQFWNKVVSHVYLFRLAMA